MTQLQRRFEPFVLLASSAGPRVERAWRDLFGDRVVRLEHADDAALLCAGLVSLLRGSVASLAAYARRLEASGLSRRSVARVARGLVPFAASIGRDGAPRGVKPPLALPRGDAPSGLDRP